jgi:hypothetical protein
MKKLAKLLLVAVLAVAAFAASAPRTLAESVVCKNCDLTGNCVDCCLCAGGTIEFCGSHCP